MCTSINNFRRKFTIWGFYKGIQISLNFVDVECFLLLKNKMSYPKNIDVPYIYLLVKNNKNYSINTDLPVHIFIERGC